jgi:hypothetical protein
MPEYRKLGRTFYKIVKEKNTYLKVVNGYYGSTFVIMENKDSVMDLLLDTTSYFPATEQEFNEAKSIAVGRISLEKIES